MFPTAKDGCAVNRTSICNHLSSPPRRWGRVSLRMSTPFYEDTGIYCAVAAGDSISNAKWPWKCRDFSSLCTLKKKKKETLGRLRRSRAAGMREVDRCINGLTARLMYKAAGKATGAEKTKHEGETERGRRRQTARTDWDSCWTENRRRDDMDVTAARTGLRSCGWNLIMWTNFVKTQKVDYRWMLEAEFIFLRRNLVPKNNRDLLARWTRGRWDAPSPRRGNRNDEG